MSDFYISKHGKQNKKVIFLLAGWQNKIWMYGLFAKILARNGYYCIAYAYNNSVLSPDTKKTVMYLTDVRNNILNRIGELKKEGYTDFSIFGTSLGSVIALMVANKTPDISKVILNTPGIDMAQTIWGWDKVKTYFKKALIEQNFTLEKLIAVWKPISPSSNIDNLHGKRILVYLSKNDRMIPYHQGQKLVRELESKKYDVKVITNNHVGHLLAGALNLLKAKTYLEFLNS